MSDNAAIEISDVSKIYKLYASPLDRLKESVSPRRRKYHQDFHALCNVSFQIGKGETVGIVGRNGSGKSTLLKIIAGVLTPSSGTVMVKGKVSALLELGAGFNPELSGIDNVYFNGTLMGFNRGEMDERLTDILAFADIGDFIHQPVKTYSSGMFVRLAFAVALSIDPDILIVDEALAVGDEAFQRKCYARILDLQKRGKTILFVSHSAASIVELCGKAMLFDQGTLLLQGAPKAVVTKYLKLLYAPAAKVQALREEILSLQGVPGQTGGGEAQGEEEAPHQEAESHPHEPLSPFLDNNMVPQSTVSYECRGAIITDPHVTSINGERVNVLVRGHEYVYTYTVNFVVDASDVRFGMMIKTVSGLELGGMVSHAKGKSISFIPAGSVKRHSFAFKCTLLPGAYFMNAGVSGTVDGSETFLHRIIDAFMFKVQPEPNLLSTGILDFSVEHAGSMTFKKGMTATI